MTLIQQCDEIARAAGWKDADDLIGYAAIHSDTERALFNGKQIGALQKMCGICTDDAELVASGERWLASPDTWRSVDFGSVCREIRGALNAERENGALLQESTFGAGI
jgi:hypothetical protein